MENIKEMKKTYKVCNFKGEYVIFNDECGNNPFELFEVEEGEVWYATDLLAIVLDPNDIGNIENIYDQDRIIKRIINNMGNQKLMDLVKNKLGEEGIENLLYNNELYPVSFNKCEQDYIANGNYGLEYTIDGDFGGYVVFEAEIKFKLWIENGRINHSVVWEFKDENNN